MKNHLIAGLTLFLLMASFSAFSQDDKSKRPSPPAEVEATVGDAEVSIDYSQPAVKGRTVWGDLVPYDEVWRTGANEATVFETSKDIKVNGSVLPAGKYSMFTIPGEDSWTVIFNSTWEQWGDYKYDSAKDVLRVEAIPQKSDDFHERMTFTINDGEAALLWENLVVPMTISAKT